MGSGIVAGSRTTHGASERAQRVLYLMRGAGGAETACAVSEDSVGSPPAVERMSKKMEREGNIMRIERLNASAPWKTLQQQGVTTGEMGERCGGVAILPADDAAARLCGVTSTAGFAPLGASIERRERCESHRKACP